MPPSTVGARDTRTPPTSVPPASAVNSLRTEIILRIRTSKLPTRNWTITADAIRPKPPKALTRKNQKKNIDAQYRSPRFVTPRARAETFERDTSGLDLVSVR